MVFWHQSSINYFIQKVNFNLPNVSFNLNDFTKSLERKEYRSLTNKTKGISLANKQLQSLERKEYRWLKNNYKESRTKGISLANKQKNKEAKAKPFDSFDLFRNFEFLKTSEKWVT